MTQTQINGATQIRSGTITNAQIDPAAGIADGKLATAYIKQDGTRAFTGSQSFGGNRATSLADGVASTDAATYGQLVAMVNGLDQKASVRAASTGNGVLASAYAAGQSLDGVTLAAGDSILLKDQTTASDNGVYVVNSSGAPTRRSDADQNAEVTGGFTVWVNEGTVNGDSQWTLTTNDTITVGTTPLAFTQTDSGAITVDSSLTKSGKQIGRAALTGDVTAGAGSNATTIANSAVTLAKQANLAANSVIGNLGGSAATPAAVLATAAATATSLATRDGNANIKFNSVARNVSSTTTAASTTTLTAASAQFQQFTGTTSQTVVLPDATTLVVGQSFIISNQSSAAIQVNANGGGNVRSVAPLTSATITLIANGTAAGSWDPGSTAVPTGLTASNFIKRETPTGTVNGSNVTFTLANTPVAGSEELYVNGIQQEPGSGNDYTISGATITMLSAPGTGDKLRVSYIK